jgi:hypothetical protein
VKFFIPKTDASQYNGLVIKRLTIILALSLLPAQASALGVTELGPAPNQDNGAGQILQPAPGGLQPTGEATSGLQAQNSQALQLPAESSQIKDLLNGEASGLAQSMPATAGTDWPWWALAAAIFGGLALLIYTGYKGNHELIAATQAPVQPQAQTKPRSKPRTKKFK